MDTSINLKEILEKHGKWLRCEEGGERWVCAWNENLCDADLCGADLRLANLRGANLRGADLRGANLCDANLCDAKNIPEIVSAQTLILPMGTLIMWKKLCGDMIAKLEVPADARRSNATGRKCRVEYAKVLEILHGDKQVTDGISQYNSEFVYSVGETVYPDSWDDNRWDECSNGIHCFITRIEAEQYSL